MIQKVRIQNFKSVLDLELELGRVNVFIGENGSGKTSVLEGIAMGGGAARAGFELISARGVRTTDIRLMKSAFPKESQESPMCFGFSEHGHGEFEFQVQPVDELGNEFTVQVSLSPTQGLRSMERIEAPLHNSEIAAVIRKGMESIRPEEGESVPVYEERLSNAIGNAIRQLVEEKTAQLKKEDFVRDSFAGHKIADFIIYSPENFALRRFDDEDYVRPLGVRGQGLFYHLTELKKEASETLTAISEQLKLIDWYEGFSIPDNPMLNERRISITDRYIQEIDQRSANEGFLYLLFYFTLFLSKYTPAFFAIDNIDNALNPRLCAKLVQTLVKLAAENNKQAIFTTHNPAVLDGLDLEDDAQRLFVIYRNADGETKARRVMPPKVVEGVEPVRLSEAFVRGYLGGLPQNF